MRSKTLSAVALCLAAAGCNWSDLDAEFLAAMPEKDDLHVHPPTETGSSKGALQSSDLGQSRDALQADAFLNLDNMGKQINAWIDGLTGGLDLVRRFAPSKRTDDSRTWGPYDDKDHPGMELQVVVRLEGETYQYLVGWRAKGGGAEFVSVIEGRFEGARAKGGNGAFTLFMDRARAVGIAPPNTDASVQVERFTLSYAHEDDAVKVELNEVVTLTADGSQRTFSFDHQRNADGSGAFGYTYTMPRNGYEISAKAQWLSSRAGRVDGTGYSTFFEKVVANHHECWNEDLEVVYREQDYDCGPPLNLDKPCVLGDPKRCAVPAPQ